MRKYTLKNVNDELVFDSKTAANMINDYFTGISPKLACAFDDDWIFFGTPNFTVIENMYVTEEEVTGFCKEMYTNKSSAIDNISSNVLKLAFLTLSKQLTYIFNLSLETATIPSVWKYATITPLFKTGDVSQCNNYRPMSI